MLSRIRQGSSLAMDIVIRMYGTEVIPWDSVPPSLIPQPYDPMTLAMKRQNYESLSSEAKEVVSIVLDRPEVVTNSDHFISRRSITRYLRRQGWKFEVILSCFRELKEFVRNF